MSLSQEMALCKAFMLARTELLVSRRYEIFFTKLLSDVNFQLLK